MKTFLFSLKLLKDLTILILVLNQIAPIRSENSASPRIFLVSGRNESRTGRSGYHPELEPADMQKVHYEVQTPAIIPLNSASPMKPYPKAVASTKTLLEQKSQTMHMSLMSVFRRMKSFVSYLWNLWTGKYKNNYMQFNRFNELF